MFTSAILPQTTGAVSIKRLLGGGAWACSVTTSSRPAKPVARNASTCRTSSSSRDLRTLPSLPCSRRAPQAQAGTRRSRSTAQGGGLDVSVAFQGRNTGRRRQRLARLRPFSSSPAVPSRSRPLRIRRKRRWQSTVRLPASRIGVVGSLREPRVYSLVELMSRCKLACGRDCGVRWCQRTDRTSHSAYPVT